MKINLVVKKNGGGSIIIDCDSEIQLKRFVETLEIALIQVFIDRMDSKRAYVYARAFAEVKEMSVLNLEDVIAEAVTGLAISGECDLPIDNKWAA